MRVAAVVWNLKAPAGTTCCGSGPRKHDQASCSRAGVGEEVGPDHLQASRQGDGLATHPQRMDSCVAQRTALPSISQCTVFRPRRVNLWRPGFPIPQAPSRHEVHFGESTIPGPAQSLVWAVVDLGVQFASRRRRNQTSGAGHCLERPREGKKRWLSGPAGFANGKGDRVTNDGARGVDDDDAVGARSRLLLPRQSCRQANWLRRRSMAGTPTRCCHW